MVDYSTANASFVKIFPKLAPKPAPLSTPQLKDPVVQPKSILPHMMLGAELGPGYEYSTKYHPELLAFWV